MDCVFCKIINGDIPSYTIYEDDIVKCFLDINPVVVGHTLIIPKKHTLDLDTIDMEVLTHILEVAKKLKLILEAKLHADGIQIVQNNGIAQDVKHYHMHLIPKYKEKVSMSVEEVYKKIKGE